ncbi:hypothetical protein BCR37DRAFT_391283 [Protomyces lactucae-debilis]|uniref:Glycoside hydrolase superfamily n=1 Tax=Protomyces lactucae-debilis TaxID=2754530 RepID=A0A1Y2FNH2_PROLT|nr:uncharacterized protein BCR37DRAFT_391283 [Protomyces lactucae-debilis]ORY85508.1 hypothetical protein BCR37DRAFT_391283 [Protomyces lactucae-debilis]
MHSHIFVGSFVNLIATFSACQALSIGYVLDTHDSTGDCKNVAQYQADFKLIERNIPKPTDGSQIIVRLSSSDKCKVFDIAIDALAASDISDMRLWFDFQIPTIKGNDTLKGNGDFSKETLNSVLLGYIVDQVRNSIKFGQACDYLAGISLEHYGGLNAEDIQAAMATVAISRFISPSACSRVMSTFKTSAFAWLYEYRKLTGMGQIEFPFDIGVPIDDPDIHVITASLVNTVDDLVAAFPDVPVVVAGVSWASPWTSVRSASSTDQQLYWQQFWCAKGDVASANTIKAVFWDSAIDGANTNGLLDKDGNVKFRLENCKAM